MTAKEFLKEKYIKLYAEEPNDRQLQRFLIDHSTIYRELGEMHRWYIVTFNVANYDGKLIGYTWYTCTGDDSIWDMDLDFNWDEVGFVEPISVQVTKYAYMDD